MTLAIRTITRLQDADDAPALGAGVDGYALTWDNATGAFVSTSIEDVASAAIVADQGRERQIPQNGLRMRLDSNSITNVGDNQPLSTWTSGIGVYLSAAEGARPTLVRSGSKFVVRFDGTANYMTIPASTMTVAQPNTIIVVASVSDADTRVLVDGDEADGRQEIASISGNLFSFAGESVNSFPYPAGLAIVAQHWSNTAGTLRVNGYLYGEAATGTNSLEGLVLGSYINKDGLFWKGDVTDLLLYDRVLTEQELQTIEYVLATKNGLTYRQIICDGDSRTAGYGASVYYDYPSVLQRSLGIVVRMRNFGIGGYPVSSMLLEAPIRIDPLRFKPDDVVVVFGGLNDIIYAHTPSQVYADLKTYWAARRAAGWRVVACTEIDANSADAIAASWRTHRATLNTLIKSDSSLYDALADLAADTNIGVDGAADTAYFDGDKVHLSGSGYAVMAGLIKTAILST